MLASVSLLGDMLSFTDFCLGKGVSLRSAEYLTRLGGVVGVTKSEGDILLRLISLSGALSGVFNTDLSGETK